MIDFAIKLIVLLIITNSFWFYRQILNLSFSLFFKLFLKDLLRRLNGFKYICVRNSIAFFKIIKDIEIHFLTKNFFQNQLHS